MISTQSQEVPYHENLHDTNDLFKLKRENVQKFILSLRKYSEETIEDFCKSINKPFFVGNANKELLPNMIILRRGKVPGMDSLYSNNFQVSVEKHKSWDKDIVLIID